MGDYTEIVTRVRLAQGVPEVVVRTLGSLALGALYSGHPPHPLFDCARVNSLLVGSSYYHVPFESRELRKDAGTWYLVGRADLKNYDEEIDLFFDWIAPHCESDSVIGWKLREESDWPTIYRAGLNGELELGTVQTRVAPCSLGGL